MSIKAPWRRKRVLVPLGSVAALAAAGTTAFAVVSGIQDPNSPGAFRACADDTTGAVTVAPGSGCAANQTPLVVGGPTDAFTTTPPGTAAPGSRAVGSGTGPGGRPTGNVLTLPLPQGRFVVTAKTRLENISGTSRLVRCELATTNSTSDATPDNSFDRLGAQSQPADHQTIPLQITTDNPAPRDVNLRCADLNGPGAVFASNSSIQAVRVDTINTSPPRGTRP